jgi:hypothetical protein
MRNDYSLPAVARDFYEACFIDDVSRGSNSYLFCVSPLYKSSIQEFLRTSFLHEVQPKSTRKPLKRRKRYSPTSRKARVLKALSRRSYKICRRRNFFPTSRLTQERRKVSTEELPTRKYKIRRRVFCLTSCSIQESEGFLYDELPTRATFSVS